MWKGGGGGRGGFLGLGRLVEIYVLVADNGLYFFP